MITLQQHNSGGGVGPKGDKGDPGYTPVKGVDYFDGVKGDTGDTGPAGADGSDATVTKAAVEAVLTGEISSHTHAGIYEPADAAIQAHIISTHAPTDADNTAANETSHADVLVDGDIGVTVASQDHTHSYEDGLGNPASDGQILSSTVLGIRSWVDQASGGTSKEYASFYLSGAGNTGLTSTEVTLTLNATGVNSNSSVFSLASNQVTVNKTGTYEINVNVYLNNSSNSRTEYSMWIENNAVEIAGTRFASYQRGYDSGMSSGVNFMIALTAGDVLQIQCKRTDGAATAGYQDANGTRFNIKEL